MEGENGKLEKTRGLDFPVPLVSFAAVIRVVTRHATLLPSGEERCVTSDDPNNGCEGDYCPPYFKQELTSFNGDHRTCTMHFLV